VTATRPRIRSYIQIPAPKLNSDSHSSAMRFHVSAVFLALAGLLGVSIAHNIQLGAHSRECFHEQLHTDDKMTVTFQVGDREFGGSGNLEVDFWVSRSLHLSTTKACLDRFEDHSELCLLLPEAVHCS